MLSEILINQCDPILEELQNQFSKDLKGNGLIYVGSKPLRNKFHLGIVGSRRPSLESQQILEKLFSLISDLPIRVISGGALGVDAQAHACALRNKLPTYAWVVGDPSCATPFTNRHLFSRISNANDSAVITPKCLYREKNRGLMTYNWLERNAWIAANSDLLLVIQAKEQSGTWSTVKISQEFGITVYAVTGSPLDACYSGNNLMISMSYAHPLSKIEEFAQELRSHIKDSYQYTEKNEEGERPVNL